MSNIEWTETTWNPVTGCSKVSPGCAHCYAEAVTKRYAGADGWPATFLPWTPENAAENVIMHFDRLDKPRTWRKPRRVFVNSMSDLFHEQVTDAFIDQVFDVMRRASQHTFQVLTKRPERMCEFVQGWYGRRDIDLALPNIWLGVSVENQHWADNRIPFLFQTPSSVRFISAEPLLGPIDLHRCPPDWVIVGGESGPKYRPFDPDWARSLRDQCAEAGVALFVKQLGGIRPGTKLDDLPEDLRIREYPR